MSAKAAAHLSKDDLKEHFNRLGLRFTPQREAVWRLFENDPAGFTIARVTAILSQQKIGQATVYRTIKALQDLGYLKWVHEDSGGAGGAKRAGREDCLTIPTPPNPAAPQR
jgi:Fe2+ or Zn2+ uptake regulation protein